MPLQPFRPLGQVDPSLQGIGLVKNIQGARQNELLNLARQAELDEFALGAPVREAKRGTELDAATLASIKQGAIEAFPFIQANDDGGLLNNIIRREQTILGRGGDTSETREIREMLQSGDQSQIDQAKQIITAIATQGQPAQAGFTLGQGQQRFGPQGQPIAAVAPTQAGFTLGQGQQRFDAQGRPIADVPAAPSEVTTKDQREIASLTRQFIAQGMEPQAAKNRAENITFGSIEQKVTDLGRVVETDIVSGAPSERPFSEAQGEPVPTPEPGQTLRDLAKVATGPVPVTTARVSSAFSFFGIDLDQPTTAAQQQFAAEMSNMIRAFSLNSKNPVQEQERIIEQLGLTPSFFTGVGTLERKMDGLERSLTLRMRQNERTMRDPNLPESLREQAAVKFVAIRDFLPILGTTQGGESPLDAEIRELKEDLGL